MGGTRFFLADLPSRTTEADLKGLFQDYGHVEHVDLKRKEQDGATKVIAFVTLQTDDPDYCVNELNWQKLHGAKLRVSLAKESFLDRLKREREENQRREQGEPEAWEQPVQSSQLLSQSNQNKRRVFGEDEEIGDDEIAPELLITKKRASHSMHNGRIVIQQEHDAKPLHIIEQHRKPAKQQPDTKVSKADQKRMESLNKMRQEHLQKKSAIQLALSVGGQAKRIKFSDDEAEPAPAKKTKRDLFADDEEGEENEQVILPQHKGKKGERLVEMQSKQSLDPRFRITSTFVDDDEENEAEHEEEEQPAPVESERQWQMDILEKVVGHKITSANGNDGKPAKSKKMLRFDPAKEDHQKMVRQKQLPPEKIKTVKNDAETVVGGGGGDASAPAPVSKAAFYMVTDTLKESLNMRGEGFSLLDMFGKAPDEEVAKRQDQLEKLGPEKILVGKNSASASKLLGLAAINPFSYDSSDSEDDGEKDAQGKEESQPQEVGNENQLPAKKKTKQKKPKIKMESFFIPKNDPRLKEAAKFFKSAKKEVDQADYDQVRNRLKLLISNKIAKTKKNQPSKDIKQKRNKRAVKN
ncbi:probable RNA-binding protein CG14230 [Drosophila serrata]|uniref:probable RNA-binding protein CG14230 n=1 Tax=Drosophila serrata TaxID=7274 RepID=UPI000A1D0E9E|nr:probable RNA-binding protein CG14230 [Drosophila serrata]